MMFLDNYRRAMKKLPEGIAEAEINVERKECIKIGVSGGRVALTDVSDVTSIYVRASGEKTGYAYTEDLGEDAQEVLLRAYNNGLISDSEQIDILNTPKTAFNPNILNDNIQSRNKENQHPVNSSAVVEKAMLLEDLVRKSDSSIKTVLATVRSDTLSSTVLNSKGVDISFKRNVYYAKVNVTAQVMGDSIDAVYSISNSSLEELDLGFLVEKINNSIKNKIEPGSFTSGEYPVVLDQSVGINIMMTAWQLFSGMKYCDGSTALKGRLGEYIGSSAFSIVDMPFHKYTGYYFPFDCEGTPGKEVMLVDKGKFTSLMHNNYSSSQLDLQPTGNAGRVALLTGNIPTDIIVTPKICCIKPGVNSTQQLLQEMGDGVYITESYDIFHSINIGSGDFAIPCRGVFIKDGKPSHSVNALSICGNLIDLFNNVIETSNDFIIDEFLLKSYCVGSPSIRLSKLQING